MINTHPAPPLRVHERIAGNLRAIMARDRITQTALADTLGWKQQYLSRRLTGDVPFDVNDLSAIAETIGLAIGDLFEEPQHTTVLDAIKRRFSHRGPDLHFHALAAAF